MSIPRSMNPLLDTTREYTGVNQPENVWFLVGKVASENKDRVSCQCSVPEGRSILFPIINCLADSVEYPELKTDDDLVKHILHDTDTIVRKDCMIDGRVILGQRVSSDPRIFTVKVDGELIGIDRSSPAAKATADGYWVFLKPLPRGNHTISFTGACEMGRLNCSADYSRSLIPTA